MLYAVERSDDRKSYVAFRFFPVLTPLSIFKGTSAGDNSIRWHKVLSAGATPMVRGRYLGRIGKDLLFLSSLCGDELCITRFDIEKSRQQKVLVPKLRDQVIVEAQVVGTRIFTQYLDAQMRISMRIYDPSGNLKAHFLPSSTNLPQVGKFSLVSGTSESKWVSFTFSAVNSYPVTIRLNLDTYSFERLENSRPEPDLLKEIVSEVRNYHSKDGTRVPIQVFSRKGSQPEFGLLSYYGAISISNLSIYSPRFLSVLNMGGLVAIANVRGGGERGET